MIVVDTNIITYLILTGDKTSLARQVYEADPQWVVPQLWKHEFLNVLVTHVRHDLLTVDGALQAWRVSQDILYRREQPVSMPLALQLSITHELSAYDAQFATLARSLGCWLVTEDQKLIKKIPENTRSMSKFLELGD